MHMYISIGKLMIPSYGLFISLGMILANVIAFIIIRKKKMDINTFLILEGYTLLGAVFGSKTLYLMVSWGTIDWSRFFELNYFNNLMKGGFVFYGGLFGGILFLLIGSTIHKLNADIYLKNLLFLVPLVHAFGRIGCHFAGCCYGISYHGLFSIKFPQGSLAASDASLFPVQLFESCLLFLLSFCVREFSKKNNAKSTVLFYFLLYSIMRFFLEFLRGDRQERHILLGISTSQYISILIILALVFWKIKQHHVLLKKNSV